MSDDPYAKFEQVKVCGDTAATYLRDYDIEPTTAALIDALLHVGINRVEVYPNYVRAWGGFEETRAVNYDPLDGDIDLALADLLTWELYLGEK